jgi:hypothetical protein
MGHLRFRLPAVRIALFYKSSFGHSSLPRFPKALGRLFHFQGGVGEKVGDSRPFSVTCLQPLGCCQVSAFLGALESHLALTSGHAGIYPPPPALPPAGIISRPRHAGASSLRLAICSDMGTVQMKRTTLPMIGLLALLAGNGCCCTRGLFGSSYAPAPTYYAAPPTTVTQAPPICAQPVAPPVVQQGCPCTCP